MQLNKKITREALEGFLAQHATEELVLDIGSGRAQGTHGYDTYFPNRHTLNIDPDRQPETVGDVHALPFDDGSYTTVLCTEVLEHCHTPQLAIAEMGRVLTSGGVLILTTRFVYPLHDIPQDYFRYTKYGLQHLFKGWDIVELTSETKTFSALAALTQRVGFQTELRGGKFTKLCIYMFAFFLKQLDWLLKKEYGDIGRSEPDTCILSTGYYVVARKK